MWGVARAQRQAIIFGQKTAQRPDGHAAHQRFIAALTALFEEYGFAVDTFDGVEDEE